MTHCELEDITMHLNNRISSIRRVLELRAIAKDQDKRIILEKIGQDVLAIDGLLDQFEKCVVRQKDLLKHLKELEGFFQEDVQDGKHLRDNKPTHMPGKGQQALHGGGPLSESKPADVQTAQQEKPRKTSKNHIREMEFITSVEFESIPQYMKGRETYDQLNAVVQNINKALTGKYKIVHQSAKTLNNATRKLLQRFKEEENKETKGVFFFVEADIKEFTQMKVDKRFVRILNMLRHCQRLRELRGGGITRYVLH
ncbi:spindle and kinetochore-associated protein 1 isoform X2 [Esox lucius]|uniref:SKA complex subunit 1 n=2 Tax=Esox lucius TaxID=8010 RepID=A0A3P8YT86_ESOLU|nr:spindle and kinetochore-associated protein 1 isoform X2 [Esox lucius]XP_010876036.1 spindle and kinetochore-associated protein 1 isoform X2 [Esox lucius]XP_010876037.1 spindle and kinetochore-associated protein 1 isoform X2 [Esox lucius]XP_010876038.1 spindle and kinetochore-associated protein 1 isoform X2 [Esox lucius]